MRPRLIVVALAGLALLAVLSGTGWNPFGVSPNVIRWVTQSEEDNFGYDVYRGPSAEGPFERINNESILGAGTTDLPQNYKFVDATIESDTIYWYFVENISLSGERERLTPVYASRPKSGGIW